MFLSSLPSSSSISQAAGNLGKMSLKAALTVGNIVKNKIEGELYKHQQHQQQQGEKKTVPDTSADAMGGSDRGENDGVTNGVKKTGLGQTVVPKLETDPSRDEQSTATPSNNKSPSRGEHYFSDDSTAA